MFLSADTILVRIKSLHLIKAPPSVSGCSRSVAVKRSGSVSNFLIHPLRPLFCGYSQAQGLFPLKKSLRESDSFVSLASGR
ncbi:hypothetical protein K1719_012185 [Acacia pycnantha]|nr:hypothetical protein K1719_012185 [Acacia pycnantha]